MNRSWVRFPQAAQKRPPLQGWTLSSMYEARAECAGERVGYRVRVSRAAGAPGWCRYRGRAAWCARGRRPARSPSAPRASLGASPRSPARPRRRPPAPQPGPPAASALALVGFSIRSLLVACRRCVGPSRSEIPPFGGGEVAVRGGVVLKVQTTSVKNAENGLLRARWSAFWAQRRLAGCVVRARTRCCER